MQHKTYFELFDCEADMNKKHEDVLRIVRSNSPYNMKVNDIVRYALWRYSAYDYPCVVCVSDLQTDILLLKDTMKTSFYRYAERMRYAHELVETLEWIRKVIISDPCYVQEKKYKKERERLERMRRHAIEKQKHIESALHAAQREHDYFKESNCCN